VLLVVAVGSNFSWIYTLKSKKNQYTSSGRDPLIFSQHLSNISCRWNNERTFCNLDGVNYACVFIPGSVQFSKIHRAPTADCLSGEWSWGVCSGGRFLCKDLTVVRFINLYRNLSVHDLAAQWGYCPDADDSNVSRTVEVVENVVTSSMTIQLMRHTVQRKRVLVAQTVGLGKYLQLFHVLSPSNRRWCFIHGYDYLSAIGIYAGRQEWHSTYNKAFVLQYVLQLYAHNYDFLFLIDADALVINPYFCVEHLLSSHQLLTAHVGDPAHHFLHPWDKNAGIVLFNLRHQKIHHLATQWAQRSLEACKNHTDVPDGRSSSTLDDQSILHDILMNYGNSDELWALLPILKNHVTNSSSSDIIQHVEHILRPDGGDWTGDSVTRRVAIGIRLVDRIKWPPSHWR